MSINCDKPGVYKVLAKAHVCDKILLTRKPTVLSHNIVSIYNFVCVYNDHQRWAPVRYCLTNEVTFLSNDVMDRYFLFTGNGLSNGSYFFDTLLRYSVISLLRYSVISLLH